MANEVKSKGKALEPARWLLQVALGLVVILLCNGHLAAQSCALCYTVVAGGGSGIIHALRSSILVLLVPPVAMFTGLILLIFRWRAMNVQS